MWINCVKWICGNSVLSFSKFQHLSLWLLPSTNFLLVTEKYNKQYLQENKKNRKINTKLDTITCTLDKNIYIKMIVILSLWLCNNAIYDKIFAKWLEKNKLIYNMWNGIYWFTSFKSLYVKRNCEMPNIQEYSLSYLPLLLSFNFGSNYLTVPRIWYPIS